MCLHVCAEPYAADATLRLSSESSSWGCANSDCTNLGVCSASCVCIGTCHVSKNRKIVCISTYIYILGVGHRVSRPRGTGSVGDSVGEGAPGSGRWIWS